MVLCASTRCRLRFFYISYWKWIIEECAIFCKSLVGDAFNGIVWSIIVFLRIIVMPIAFALNKIVNSLQLYTFILGYFLFLFFLILQYEKRKLIPLKLFFSFFYEIRYLGSLKSWVKLLGLNRNNFTSAIYSLSY